MNGGTHLSIDHGRGLEPPVLCQAGVVTGVLAGLPGAPVLPPTRQDVRFKGKRKGRCSETMSFEREARNGVNAESMLENLHGTEGVGLHSTDENRGELSPCQGAGEQEEQGSHGDCQITH